MMWRFTPGRFRFPTIHLARATVCAAGLLLVQAARAESCTDLPVLVRSADTVVLDEMLLRLIASEAGCTLKERAIDDITIARRMQMLKNGDIAINAATAASEDRRAYAWFSKPYRDNVLRLYAHPDVAPEKWPREYQDLLNTGLTVAVVRQARFGPR